MMATECYLGTIPLLPDSSTLPLPTARCIPEDGICFTALSRGGGQTTAQLGCWPSQSTMKLAWLGVPECKNEVGRLMCLCLETLCNGFIPSPSENSPEGGDLQGLMMIVLVLILIVMLIVVFYSLNKLIKKWHVKGHTDLENGDNSSYAQGQASPYQIAPSSFYNYPPSPPDSQGSPAPLLRMSSAPAYLPSPSQSGDQQVFTKVVRRQKGNTAGRVRSRPVPVVEMEGPLIKYLDMSNCQTFTKPELKVKRVDNGEAIEGSCNMAFAKEVSKLKSPGKVTAV